jgi:predicted ester cyclase
MTNRNEHPHLQLIRAYFKTLEEAPSDERLSSFFAPDVSQHEYPNRLVEAGAARGLAELLEGNRRGQTAVQNQRYVIQTALVDGDRVAVELAWSAELKVPLGKLGVGQLLRATCGVFFRIAAGRIVEQHNFDCFEPF